MTIIKAIETQYNGYRFRSRLEARWAVFFDAAGIAYQYEPEGYDLGEQGWYLPDFYLTDLDMFVEVKGRTPTVDEECRAGRLHGLSGKKVALLGDIPRMTRADEESYFGYSFCFDDEQYDTDYYFCCCPECGKYGFHFSAKIRQCACERAYNDDAFFEECYSKARQARFEYGETPRVARIRRNEYV